MDEIQREHRSIRHQLEQLERVLQRERAQTEREAAADLLVSIARGLVDHFRREEASDMYVGIPRRVPSLAERLAELRVEHGELTELVIDAQGVAERLEAARGELMSLAEQLIERVRAHERAEAEVLQRAFVAE